MAEKGDEVELIKPYTVNNGYRITQSDDCFKIPIGTHGILLSNTDLDASPVREASVLWDGFENLGSRRIDADCLRLHVPDVSEEELTFIQKAIAKAITPRNIPVYPTPNRDTPTEDLLDMLDDSLRNGSSFTRANLCFRLLCERLGYDRDQFPTFVATYEED